ncbi:hypothetical protein CAPTEDRAFT_160085 [Capitella teleta]|uniref:BRCT domain-containing protein n=1 Tax=Capitella teleta TaxID=283909 RepID=R7TLB0_CAPTE|nr:hypothetical protein CAPTEDRAFT_160085 [Capitella teleta]|eukprot:ELT94638.1 hypothetical protein CAPTEDRAFT_160085 [Capitella teleta]
MFTGLLDEKAEKAVVKLGGEVVDSIFKCTHLVCDQVRRTVKFLCGVSRGLVIVRPDWLHQSEEQGVFQDPVTYFVRDASAEKKFKFRLTESVERANQKGMLKGHKCFITANVKPEPKQMADIIKCSGGQLLKSMPKTSSGHTVVISCEDDEAICQPALLAGIPVVSAEFLLTGILRQEVDFELHKIFKEVHPCRSSSRR